MKKTYKNAMKVIILMTFSLIIGIQAKAQLNYADSLQMRYDSLDVKYFPTGILHNTSPFYPDCYVYDTTNSIYVVNQNYIPNPYSYVFGTFNMNYATFNNLYFDLYLSSVRDSVIITPSDYYLKDSIAKLNADFPISILRMNFHEMDRNAIGKGLIWYDTLTDKFTIMPDTIWPPDSLNYPDSIFYLVQNPDSLAYHAFFSHWVHGATARNSSIYTNWDVKNYNTTNWDFTYSANFSLPHDLLISNDSSSFQKVRIDFDDGNGFVDMNFNQIKQITYHEIVQLDPIDNYPLSEIQIKHTKEIVLKVPPIIGQSDSIIIKFPITIIINENPADTTFEIDSLDFIDCIVTDGDYSASNAKVSIRYANSNYRKLTKPIIISAGFESDLRPFGAIHYEGIASGYIFDSKGKRVFEHLKEMPFLLDSLHNNGYDIIFIDQEKPRDYIQNNGLGLIKLIQWTNNQLKINGSNAKLVVMGASMGGLIVQYGLRMMEMRSCCHNTRLYATMDSPHNGANISIGAQYFVNDLRDFAEIAIPKWRKLGKYDLIELRSSIISAYDDVFQSPAARQMLLYHKGMGAYAEMTKFYSFLDSIGHPLNCRRIAISNGSEQAKAHFISDPNKMLLSMYQIPLAPILYLPNPNPWFNWLVMLAPKEIINITAYSESQAIFYNHNDVVNATRAYGNAWKLHLYSALGMSVTDVIGGVYPVLYAPMQVVKGGIKIGSSAGFVYLNTVGTNQTSISSTPYPLCYTEAPGSQSKTFEDIADVAGEKFIYSGDRIEAGTPSHTFMPTGSTLDLHTDSLLLNIKNAYLTDQSITPFDCYWASGRTGREGDVNRNMLHVEFDKFNREWIQEQVLNDWELKAANGEYKGILSSYYNYGRPDEIGPDRILTINKPYQTILYTLDIENNGRLHVNKQDKIGLSTGTLYPRQGSTFHLKTNCNTCDTTIIKIKDGGKFIVGELHNGMLNKGDVHFCRNSQLEIFNNGQLIINDSSSLVIEEGATLVIHNGAYILLDGPNAVLEIKGKIVIDDNSTLEPHGTGFIRFAAKMDNTNYNDFWDIGHNSSLVLANSPTSITKKAEIKENVIMPDSLAQYYNYAIIALDSMKAIYSYGSIQAQNAVFTAIDTNKFYRSVSVYGQPNTRFGSCRFEFGNMGLYAAMGSGGNTITLDTCTFTKNYIGLYTMDQYVSLNNCKANYNLDYGWVGAAMQANCTTTRSQFNNNGYSGIKFDSQFGVSLNLRESELNDNFQNGVEIEWGTLQANCSEFMRNGQAGIYAKEKSEINLSGISKNAIRHNVTGILFNMAKSIRLENGYNNFSGNQYYLIGEMMPDNYYIPNTSPYGIDIDNNLMPATFYTGVNTLPVNLYFYDPQHTASYQMPMNGWTQSINSLQCICISSNTAANYVIYKVFEGLTTTSVIDIPLFPNTYLVDALKGASMQMSYGDEYIGNDTLAIAMFKAIFDTIPPNINEDEQWAVAHSLGLMITALTNAIERGLIDPNRALDGMPVDEYVAMIADEIQQRLNDVEYASQYAAEQEAYFHLLMAQMYRAAEHYDYALSILQNSNYFFNTTLNNQADYWNCICNAENQLLKGNIERSQYEMQIDSCHEMSTARRAMFMPLFGTTIANQNSNENQILGVYPNPAEQLIAVEFSLTVKEVSVELSDLSGRLIWQTTKTVNGKQLRLKLPKVSSGAYMLKTTTENQVFNNKIIIR